jgi:hypothetical protein
MLSEGPTALLSCPPFYIVIRYFSFVDEDFKAVVRLVGVTLVIILSLPNVTTIME